MIYEKKVPQEGFNNTKIYQPHYHCLFNWAFNSKVTRRPREARSERPPIELGGQPQSSTAQALAWAQVLAGSSARLV